MQGLPVDRVQRCAGQHRLDAGKPCRRDDAAADGEPRRRDPAAADVEQPGGRDDARREGGAQADLAPGPARFGVWQRHQQGFEQLRRPTIPAQPGGQRQRRRPVGRRDHGGGVERQQRRDQAARAAGDVAADGGERAHRRAGGRSQRRMQQREVSFQLRVPQESGERGERADAQLPAHRRNAAQGGDAAEVDEPRRPLLATRPVELQRRAAGDHPRPRLRRHHQRLGGGARAAQRRRGADGDRHAAPAVVPKRMPFSFSQRR